MALSRSVVTNALRSFEPLPELPLPDSPAPATEAIAKTATTVITAPARRPPRPHNAFERASPREPRPQRAFERSSLFARCRISPFLSPSVFRAGCAEPQIHMKPAERKARGQRVPPPEGSEP